MFFYTETDIPDLTGKIIIVTGGIGNLQTAAILAGKGAKVYLGVRSDGKYKQALKDSHASHPATAKAQIEFLKVDLSTAAGARAAADDFEL
ncbi:hypothetical protein D9757_009299 [Collybiopsis confluens]|uniref:Uncharacterized protein n=1 Tax=Collybiopsis confluens TaxID=2823264 RepID=A0A8H5G394_9AGAR|nr:hypothetical protein D9757_012350 [Collybiopsis confluens]KAF5376201.1 hypothetical protein D9757_009299 [Collybiopsis confluens]